MAIKWWLRWRQVWRRRCERRLVPTQALQARARLDAAHRRTLVYQQMAPAVADLPPHELAARMSRAFNYPWEGR